MKNSTLALGLGSCLIGSVAYAGTIKLDPTTSKAMYRALTVPAVDHDDIVNKTFEGATISCDYWREDRRYICTVEMADPRPNSVNEGSPEN